MQTSTKMSPTALISCPLSASTVHFSLPPFTPPPNLADDQRKKEMSLLAHSGIPTQQQEPTWNNNHVKLFEYKNMQRMKSKVPKGLQLEFRAFHNNTIIIKNYLRKGPGPRYRGRCYPSWRRHLSWRHHSSWWHHPSWRRQPSWRCVVGFQELYRVSKGGCPSSSKAPTVAIQSLIVRDNIKIGCSRTFEKKTFFRFGNWEKTYRSEI